VRIKEATDNAARAKVGDKVQFEVRNLFDTPIKDADVLTMYLLPSVNLQLRPRILEEMKPGSRIVSHAFNMGDWDPDLRENVDGRDVYFWIVPAKVEGKWTITDGGALGLAMVFVLLTYGGWNEVAYLSGEMKDPRRDMVRIALAGTAVVTAIYVAINFAYLNAFGFEGLRASKAVGADLMRVVVGDYGALLLAIVICCAALSTLNATIFTGARAYYALGRDLPIIRRLGVWDERGDNPANAFLLQGAIALALVFFGALTRDGFSAMVDYTAPVFWFFLLLTAISLFVFRWREPASSRPFSTPLYPLTPAIFVLICGYLLYSSLAYTGMGALFGIGVVALGIPLALWGSGEEKDSA
jgi:amino acid transporter